MTAFKGRQFIGLVLDGLLDRLSDDDPAGTGMLRYCNELGVESPKEYRLGTTPHGLGNLDSLPAVLISPEISEMERETSGQSFTTTEEHTLYLDIILPLTGDNPNQSNAETARRLARYASAAESSVEEDRTLGLSGAAHAFTFVTAHEYRDVPVSGAAGFYPRVRLVVRVETEE